MKTKELEQKIAQITKQTNPLSTTYTVKDWSNQKQLFICIDYSIRYTVDYIHYPADLSKSWPRPEAWQEMARIESELLSIATLSKRKDITLNANARTKSGLAARQEAETKFRTETAVEFLAVYKAASGKKVLAELKQRVAHLQARQKTLIPEMRKHNSEYISDRRNAKAQERQADAEALKAGRFWDASKDALKNYFHPPFSRNYLADVSAKWRAALYTEMDSTGWKAGKGDWRHKLVGTGRGYLCGIDDNGDEWGHNVNLRGWMGRDKYDDLIYSDTSVEEAMCELFSIETRGTLEKCVRQGDLLFCKTTIRKTSIYLDRCQTCGYSRYDHELKNHEFKSVVQLPVEMHSQEGPWEIRESHTVESDGLMRNGRFFSSVNPIRVTHTSHAALTLAPGEYQLYALDIANAD